MNVMRTNRSHERTRGAIIVEAAVVLPLILALFAGFVDFAWVLNDLQSVRQETREVARDAVVGNSGATGCSHNAGTVNATTEGLICEVKSRLGSDVVVRLELPDAGGYVEGNAVRVCVQKPYESLTGVYATMINDGAATVKVESRIEQVAAVAFESFSEPPLTGQSWGFCA